VLLTGFRHGIRLNNCGPANWRWAFVLWLERLTGDAAAFLKPTRKMQREPTRWPHSRAPKAAGHRPRQRTLDLLKALLRAGFPRLWRKALSQRKSSVDGHMNSSSLERQDERIHRDGFVPGRTWACRSTTWTSTAAVQSDVLVVYRPISKCAGENHRRRDGRCDDVSQCFGGHSGTGHQ